MRVLLVEDDLRFAEVLARGLRRCGYQVNHAATARAAMLESDRDLVLLDLTPPDRDGLDVCRQLRAESNVPIIVVSARGSELDRVGGLRRGADDYLVKPFSRSAWPSWRLERIAPARLRRNGVTVIRGRGKRARPKRGGWSDEVPLYRCTEVVVRIQLHVHQRRRRHGKVGKVTFKAIATLQDARDALPADNDTISSPTKVNRA
jgi:CheY-like chemotaxis protein